MVNILENKEAFAQWRTLMFNLIDNTTTVEKIFIMVRDPWKLTFLKYCKPNIDTDLFVALFAEAWVFFENPNGDANCSIKELITWFKRCSKDILREQEDFEVYNSLPDEFEVYRGVSRGRNPRGLSWTRNLEKAKWFAHRFDSKEEKGYIQKVFIRKENVLAYFNTRNEDETVVDSNAIKKLIVKI